MKRAVLVFAAGSGNRNPAGLNQKIVEVVRMNYRNDMIFAEWPIRRQLCKVGLKSIWVRKRGKEAVRKMAEYLKLFSFDEILLLTTEDIIEEHQQLLRFYGVRFRLASECKRVSHDTLLRKIKKFLMGYTKSKKKRKLPFYKLAGLA